MLKQSSVGATSEQRQDPYTRLRGNAFRRAPRLAAQTRSSQAFGRKENTRLNILTGESLIFFDDLFWCHTVREQIQNLFDGQARTLYHGLADHYCWIERDTFKQLLVCHFDSSVFPCTTRISSSLKSCN
jgi:hypothetical protein